MILKDKVAIIYGATGSVGSAIATKFAIEGAIVILVARDYNRLKHLSKEIQSVNLDLFYYIKRGLKKASFYINKENVYRPKLLN